MVFSVFGDSSGAEPLSTIGSRLVGARNLLSVAKTPSAANCPSRPHITRVAQRKNNADAQQDCEPSLRGKNSLGSKSSLAAAYYSRRSEKKNADAQEDCEGG
ncbi:hypothetical protein Bbelb_291060 [Branchiostoma belcheri]|nr:hypothetical protein Bbelb_291060 [Branchiostoma belcheri]